MQVKGIKIILKAREKYQNFSEEEKHKKVSVLL